MSRFLLLLVFVLWMSGPDPMSRTALEQRTGHHLLLGVAWFVGFYAILVGMMGLWSRWVARRVHRGNLQGRLRRFNFMMFVSRLLIPAWFGVGVYFLGWKTWVDGRLLDTPLSRVHIDLPNLLMGSLPAFLAWMGLWWAQYPADRALREQSLLVRLESDLPIMAPPHFWSYLAVNFRLQLLFTIAPVLLLVLLKDLLGLALPPLLNQIPWMHGRDTLVQAMISLPSFALIFIYGPEILRRVLQTQSMPDTPLRRRLEAICHRNNIRYKDVLLWHTQYHMGNAAVMGFIPRVRYILLSDLLLETMTDDQIEAVFAHEVGHVMHKHMFWLVAAMAALLLCFAGPGTFVLDHLEKWRHGVPFSETAEVIVELAIGGALFWLVFGFVSRHCERQADVFAARTLQNEYEHSSENQINALAQLTAAVQSESTEIPGQLPGPLDYQAPSQVGQYGAQVFCSALERVASVNNIPIAARSWCHGSIASRIRFLHDLGRQPSRTIDFDRAMTRIFVGVMCALCVFGVWTMVELANQ